jgi:hypothetical protein
MFFFIYINYIRIPLGSFFDHCLFSTVTWYISNPTLCMVPTAKLIQWFTLPHPSFLRTQRGKTVTVFNALTFLTSNTIHFVELELFSLQSWAARKPSPSRPECVVVIATQIPLDSTSKTIGDWSVDSSPVVNLDRN